MTAELGLLDFGDGPEQADDAQDKRSVLVFGTSSSQVSGDDGGNLNFS